MVKREEKDEFMMLKGKLQFTKTKYLVSSSRNKYKTDEDKEMKSEESVLESQKNIARVGFWSP